MNTSYRCLPFLQGWCGRVTLGPSTNVAEGQQPCFRNFGLEKRVPKISHGSFSLVFHGHCLLFCVLQLATIHVSCFFLWGQVCHFFLNTQTSRIQKGECLTGWITPDCLQDVSDKWKVGWLEFLPRWLTWWSRLCAGEQLNYYISSPRADLSYFACNDGMIIRSLTGFDLSKYH